MNTSYADILAVMGASDLPVTGRATLSLTRHRLHEQVATEVAGDIVSGRLPADGSVPSSSDVGLRYGVSRTVARETVHALVAAGLVHAQQGRRTAVLPDREWDMLNPLVLGAMMTEGRGEELLEGLGEFRLVIEPQATEWMALRGADRDLDTARELAASTTELALAGADRRSFLDHDRAFHVNILRSCQNLFLVAMQRKIDAAMAIAFLWAELGENELRTIACQHQEIADAVLARDGAAARDAMARHVLWATDIDLSAYRRRGQD